MPTQDFSIHLTAPVTVAGPAGSAPVESMVARGLLARLALEPGRPIAYHEIVDSIWQDHEPSSARSNLRTAASTLRKLVQRVGADATALLRTHRACPGQANGGLTFRAPDGTTDVHRVDRLVGTGLSGVRRGQLEDCRRTCAALGTVSLNGFGTDLPTSKWFTLQAQQVQRLSLRAVLVRCKTDLLTGDLVTAESHAWELSRSCEAAITGEALIAVCDFLSNQVELALDRITALREKHRDVGIDPPVYLNVMQRAVLNDGRSELLDLVRSDMTF